MASGSSPGNTNDAPSSPEDIASSPIGNTFSSPTALRRRRRGRSSTPSQFATPSPSRLAPSNSTPPTSRPSAARCNGKNGRGPATPSYTDEIPPSSEDGEEDGADDVTPTFVWGTNISVQDVKLAIEMLVKHFREAKESSDDLFREGKYMAAIRKVIEIEGEWIDVDANDVFDYDPDLYNKMVRFPLEVLAIFDIVLMNIVSTINPLFEKHVQVRIFNLRTSTSMRNLNPSG